MGFRVFGVWGPGLQGLRLVGFKVSGVGLMAVGGPGIEVTKPSYYMQVYCNVSMYVIYIYVYIHREKGRERERARHCVNIPTQNP